MGRWRGLAVWSNLQPVPICPARRRRPAGPGRVPDTGPRLGRPRDRGGRLRLDVLQQPFHTRCGPGRSRGGRLADLQTTWIGRRRVSERKVMLGVSVPMGWHVGRLAASVLAQVLARRSSRAACCVRNLSLCRRPDGTAACVVAHRPLHHVGVHRMSIGRHPVPKSSSRLPPVFDLPTAACCSGQLAGGKLPVQWSRGVAKRVGT